MERRLGGEVKSLSWRPWRLGGSNFLVPVVALIIALLAAASALTGRQNDGTPISLPTPLTLIGWLLALLVLLIWLWRHLPRVLAVAVLLELWLASQIMPYNALVPPDAYSAQRFTESYLLAANAAQTPPARMLSISGLLFDPGDRAALESQYNALGLSPETKALAFDTVKLRETLGANLPLIYNIPSADGFDGGLLPTAYYTAFTSLLLPPGELRTIDGRLREILAKPECGGACLPEQRWLDLMNVRYLITDKIYDLVNDGIFYDTTFTETLSGKPYRNPQGFTANAIDVLCNPCGELRLHIGATIFVRDDASTVPVGSYTRLRFRFEAPTTVDALNLEALDTSVPFSVRAVTLVDTRTGDFQQLAPYPWERTLSSDVKLYQNSANLLRAFVIPDARFVADDDFGTEDALNLMRHPFFDETQVVIISKQPPVELGSYGAAPPHGADVTAYTHTRITVAVNAPAPAYLVLTDAYYPGWVATVNGVETPIERADVMFRAVQVPRGESEVVFEYRPAWLPLAPLVGGAAWAITLIAALALRRATRFMRA